MNIHLVTDIEAASPTGSDFSDDSFVPRDCISLISEVQSKVSKNVNFHAVLEEVFIIPDKSDKKTYCLHHYGKIKKTVNFCPFTDIYYYAPSFKKENSGNIMINDSNEKHPILFSNTFNTSSQFSNVRDTIVTINVDVIPNIKNRPRLLTSSSFSNLTVTQSEINNAGNMIVKRVAKTIA